MHLYEVLENMEIHPEEEMEILHRLFSEEGIGGQVGPFTLESYIDTYYFDDFKMKKRCLEISDLRDKLEISESDFDDSFERMFLFVEFLLNAMDELLELGNFNSFSEVFQQCSKIKETIDSLLNDTNHECKKVDKLDWIVVEKNAYASQAVEFIEDADVAMDVIEYNHVLLKGNLEKKKKLLTSLARYAEPILKDKESKIKDRYNKLFEDTDCILNNFDLRHNNVDGPKRNEYVVSLSANELEAWYDKAYNMLLEVIIAKENFQYCKEIEEKRRENIFKS